MKVLSLFWTCAVMSMGSMALAQDQAEPQSKSLQRSPLQQKYQGVERRSALELLPYSTGVDAAQFPLEFRTLDGSDNNVRHPDWGVAEAIYKRLLRPEYADGLGAPNGADRPSARAISNAVVAQASSIPNAYGASDFMWQWGQFLDHDLDETPIADPAEAFDIEVPIGDVWFDPQHSGTALIPLDRSGYDTVDGVRRQLNLITAYIDASNVYGSDDIRAHALRTLDGSGRLRTSTGGLLPFNEEGLANAPTTEDIYFLAGDVRANEQVGLTAMHTLFVREHNYWARHLRVQGMRDGEQIYQMARAMVTAEIQAISYREFLPKLLGPSALRQYRGYRDDVPVTISNEFATAAYRFGHTMLSPNLLRLEADGSTHAAGHLSLAAAFFAPQETVSAGIEPVLRGLASQRAQEIDSYLIDEVRNLLFGPPGAGGLDLAALNIQRGRDHGLPSYHELRRVFGPGRADSFASISQSAEVQARLSQVYAAVDDIDAWVGLLSEDHVPGAMVGPTLQGILVDQFQRLRDGDRFWYESYFSERMVELIERQTLARIIRRNTEIGDELPDDVFLAR